MTNELDLTWVVEATDDGTLDEMKSQECQLEEQMLQELQSFKQLNLLMLTPNVVPHSIDRAIFQGVIELTQELLGHLLFPSHVHSRVELIDLMATVNLGRALDGEI